MTGVLPEVEIELDQTRKLIEDFNALRQFERVTGRNSLAEDILVDVDATTLTAWVWACLLREDPTVTLDHVGSLIHPGNFEYVYGKVQEQRAIALEQFGSSDEDKPGDATGEANPSGGPSSGPSDATTSV
jgi:hypothetical protein